MTRRHKHSQDIRCECIHCDLLSGPRGKEGRVSGPLGKEGRVSGPRGKEGRVSCPLDKEGLWRDPTHKLSRLQMAQFTAVCF